jgi:hypothetical protein
MIWGLSGRLGQRPFRPSILQSTTIFARAIDPAAPSAPWRDGVRAVFCLALYHGLFASGIPIQVAKPSVSRAAILQGIALTIFVEPSGPRMARPVSLVSATGA